MNGMGRVGMMTMAVLTLTACYEHTYSVGAGAPVGPVVYDEWHHHWLGGLIGERELRIRDYCPSGNATVHNEQSFLNGLVSVLTTGIYTPTTVTIRCARAGRGRDFELDRSDVMAILSSPAFLERVEALLPDRLAEAEVGVRALQEQQ